MASMTTATSEWIQFFRDAGIPPGMAATYAVSFVDNRIQKTMLMDLSKDIMMDLGITVIGDIIAILKHAKHVYRQDMCKMATEAISSGQTSVQAELRRAANTPATRMIANALSRDSPPSTPVRRPDNRLSVTISNKSSKMVASQPSAEVNGLAVKRRRVTSEIEGKYIISMPKGTTARSRRILAQQAKKAKSLKRTSVFERLGSESKMDTVMANKQVTGVFSRLGKVDKDDDDDDDDAEMDIADSAAANEDSDGEGSVLQYAGVLKRPILPSKKELARQKAKPITLYRLNKSKLPLSESTPSSVPSSTSSSQEGAPKRRILRRLGKPPTASPAPAPAPASSSVLQSSQSTETQDSQVTSSRSKASFTLASPKVSSSTGTGRDSHGAQMDATTVSVFKRLGAKRI
ncbi:uncharacterized protein C19orf47 homolog isoform X2 [Neoarius graeffei]|uniref:uncharacterized protein C19orf47 homolog isoform X2 n=1 Tax=Neoarius graeffei TaxID=443677 RepID=UPI00298D382E|nr:uncharacterized protein C19orf47 homolog isoform X2 [Neoarius graeffei]